MTYPKDQMRAWPRFALKNAHLAKGICGVYALWHGPMLVYVGKAVCIGTRCRQHYFRSPGKSLRALHRPNDATFIATETESEALALERKLIEQHLPVRNIAYNKRSVKRVRFPGVGWVRV